MIKYSKLSLFKTNFNNFKLLFKNFTTNVENKTIDKSNDDTPQPKKKFDFIPPKKQIYNKKTHYRNLEIDNMFDPPKNFEEQDEKEMTHWHQTRLYDRHYIKLNNNWQKNLAKKKRKKALTKFNFENYVYT
jgi:hypothetical protein